VLAGIYPQKEEDEFLPEVYKDQRKARWFFGLSGEFKKDLRELVVETCFFI